MIYSQLQDSSISENNNIISVETTKAIKDSFTLGTGQL
jgi:hypothetical protein